MHSFDLSAVLFAVGSTAGAQAPQFPPLPPDLQHHIALHPTR